jgi:AraC-like DNA-binding protein
MACAPAHRARVLPTRWAGIHACEIDSARHFPRHWHATHGFGVLDDGAQQSASGRGAVEAFAGDVISTHPGEVHDGRPLGSPSRRWRMLYVEPDRMRDLLAPPGTDRASDLAVVRPVIQDPRLAAALRDLFSRLDRARPGDGVDALACDEALAQATHCLSAHVERARPSPDADAGLTQVRDRLAADLLAPPSLTELAEMAGLSRYQLLRRFERAHGVPPHAWLLMQRAEAARRLIRQGLALADAAAATGFADQSHLGRVFLRQFGFTPGAWRAATIQHPGRRPGR